MAAILCTTAFSSFGGTLLGVARGLVLESGRCRRAAWYTHRDLNAKGVAIQGTPGIRLEGRVRDLRNWEQAGIARSIASFEKETM